MMFNYLKLQFFIMLQFSSKCPGNRNADLVKVHSKIDQNPIFSDKKYTRMNLKNKPFRKKDSEEIRWLYH